MADGECERVCKVCERLITASDKVVSCGASCAEVFHITCASITETEYKTLTKNRSLFWKCVPCLSDSETAPAQIVKQVSKLTNAVIDLQKLSKSQEAKIQTLSDLLVASKIPDISQIQQKSKKHNAESSSSTSFASKVKAGSAAVTSHLVDRPAGATNVNKVQNQGTRPQNYSKKPSQHNSNKIMSNTDTQDDEFTEVRGPPRRRTHKTGTASPDSACPLVAADKKAHLHVWRLHPDTKIEDVKEYLANLCNDQNIEVEAQNAKGNYASYRVSADFSHLETLQDPNNWPQNACINKFKFLSNPKFQHKARATFEK
jgi:hypothetical protein